MQRTSKEQREQEYLKRWHKAKTLRLPSWWNAIAPGFGPRFWCAVEAMRKEAGAARSDYSAISYIIHKLRKNHERTR